MSFLDDYCGGCGKIFEVPDADEGRCRGCLRIILPKRNVVGERGDQIFLCQACGRRSKDQHGLQPIDPGWDESCILSAVLVWEVTDQHGLYHLVEEVHARKQNRP